MDTVLNWLWQGCLVALVTHVLLRALERTPARTRYAVCWGALALVLALPLLALVPRLGTPPTVLVTEAPRSFITVASAWWTSPTAVLVLWTLWSMGYGVRLAAATLALRRARQRCQPFPRTLETRLRYWAQVTARGRRARLVVSDDVRAAAVLGCGSPVVAVSPALLRRFDVGHLDRVLVHEWAHIQRRDDVANVVRLGVNAIAGWHPAVWWIDRRLQAEREVACDEMAVAVTGAPKQYAACLAELASLPCRPVAPLPALGALSTSTLASRVRRILSPQRLVSSGPARIAAAASLILIAVLALTVSRLLLVRATVFQPDVLAPAQIAPSAARMDLTSSVPQLAVTPVAGTRFDTRGGQRPPISRGTVRSGSVPATRVAPTPVSIPDEAAVEASRTPAPETQVTTSQELPPSDPESRATSAHIEPLTSRQPDTSSSISLTANVSPESGWTKATNAGVAVGQRSKDAGLATAGFFTRVGKRIAGSF